MQLIDFEKLYSLAHNSSLEDFLNATAKMANTEDLPAVQKFSVYMERYEKQILPSLLNDSHAKVSPAKFAQIVINEVKKEEKPEVVKNIFASKLTGNFQMPQEKTEYSLNNMSKSSSRLSCKAHSLLSRWLNH